MELDTLRSSYPVSLTGVETEAESLTPTSERSTALGQSPPDTATAGVSGARAQNGEQSDYQECMYLADTTKKDGLSCARQSLLSRGTDGTFGWPTESMKLSTFTITCALALLWKVAITLVPLLFIALAAASAQLNNEPISEWGERVIAATRIAPTVFPIIFAALVGRFMRSLARYLAERGATVSVGCHLWKHFSDS